MERNRALSSEIQDAIEKRQFEPYFQPQFDAKTGLLAGAEILMRWQHPVEGTLTPAAFMSVAEQLRVVPEIDRQIMEKTLGALKRFGACGIEVPKISLNASSERLHDPDTIDLAHKIASQGTRVAFELLESILVEEESEVFRMHLDRLRDVGIEFEIDDFGSGHASILGLLESGATALKIDRRLIKPLGESERNQNLVRAIIEIAETLGIKTVAEGVESDIQRRILLQMGCDTLQGFLFSEALSETDFAEFYRISRRKQNELPVVHSSGAGA